MEMRYHGSYGHGLRPGTTADINCPNCKREDAIAEMADDLRVMMRGGLSLDSAHSRLYHLVGLYEMANADNLASAVLIVREETGQ